MIDRHPSGDSAGAGRQARPPPAARCLRPLPEPPRQQFALLAARPRRLSRHLRLHHRVPVPARARRRHQHAAHAGRPGPPLHQQDRLPRRRHPSGRRGRLPVPPRPHQELHQARHRPARRPPRIDHGRVYVNGKRLPEPYVPARYTDDRSQPETCSPPTSTSSWATTAPSPDSHAQLSRSSSQCRHRQYLEKHCRRSEPSARPR